MLFMKPNRPYDEIYVLDNLNSFDYVQIISMIFKKWCMSEECWIDLKCLSVCCGWDLWRNYDLNDFKMLIKMLDLFSFKRTWFSNCMIL